MRLRQFPLLADHNVHAGVAAFLRAEGFEVVEVADIGLAGATDAAVLAAAHAVGRVVLTHDADFGALALPQGLPFVGIVYLRPGHVGPQPTVDSLRRVLAADPELTPPFLLVAKRTGDEVKIRVRSLAPPAANQDDDS